MCNLSHSKQAPLPVPSLLSFPPFPSLPSPSPLSLPLQSFLPLMRYPQRRDGHVNGRKAHMYIFRHYIHVYFKCVTFGRYSAGTTVNVCEL